MSNHPGGDTAYFKVGCRMQIIADASPVGLGVVPPSVPWQDCEAVLLGPLPTGESILVVVDYYSCFLEVAILKFTTIV